MQTIKGKRQRFEFRDGFTLLEMIISIGLFSVLVIASIGITLGVSNAQLKVASLQVIQDNIRFSIELITKELRTGTNYQLAVLGCPGIIGSGLRFTGVNQRVLQERYYYHADTNGDGVADAIMRVAMTSSGSIDCGQARQFTAEEIIVEQFIIQLQGAAKGVSDGQPRVTMTLKVKAKEPRFGAETAMTLQTTVTQRVRDF